MSASRDVALAVTDAFPHLRADGAVHMVDVGEKPETHRVAVAEGFLRTTPEVLAALRSGTVQKGDALAVARVAGIQGAKKTSDLIPLAHPLALTKTDIELSLESEGVRVCARVETRGRTGVEMESMVAVMTAALSLYDMVKAQDRAAEITDVRLLRKSGGRSGLYERDE